MTDCNCVFCRIVKGELPSYKIYEDESTYAFLDISKDIDGHTLVVPKGHYTNVLDCPNEILEKVIDTVKKVSNHYINECKYDGINILNANNTSAGQSVFHLHFHIIPRRENDNENLWPTMSGAKHDLSQTHQELKLKN